MNAIGDAWRYCVSLGNVFVLLGLLALVIVYVAVLIATSGGSGDKK